MVWISNAQVRAIAAQFGHRDLAVVPTKRGTFVATCSCGMRTTQRRTAELAAEAAAHHMLKVARAAIASGAPLASARDREGKGSPEPAAVA